MIDKFINAKSRDNKSYKDFFKYLQNFSNEEKCSIIAEVAENLIEKGGKDNIFSAETILVHATQKYMNDISDTNYKALVYFRLGQLYELHIESFIKAYTYYEKYALNNTINEGSHAILLRALILRDNFKCSEELENELNLSLCEYDMNERNDRLYESLGSLIVARHKGETERKEALIKKLKNIVKGDEFFFLDFVLTKEKTPVRLKVPQKVIDYIATL
jgi:hypothetical protein